MSNVELHKVARIGQKYKDIVFGYVRKAELLLPSGNPYFNVVDLVKHLCLLYYYCMIESSILTDEQSSDFLELLEKNNKYLGTHEWKLIYRGTMQNTQKYKCVKQVYDKPNLMCIFLGMRGDICGGYTSNGWSMSKHNEINRGHSNYYSKDSKAFVFSIKSKNVYKPLILDIKPEETHRALRYSERQYCVFGSGFTLFLETNYIYCNNTTNFESFPNIYHLLGGQHGEKVKMVEIFQLK
eukprot:45671_1